MFQIGVVGLGIGNQHALAIIENSKCDLKYLCDFDLEKIESFKADHNLPNLKAVSYETMLHDESLDVVSLASFDNDHYRQVIEALKHGKHVFVEKPLCQTEAELVEIVNQYKQSSSGLSSNLVLRTSELFNYVKNLISCGDLGEIYSFEGDYLYGRIHKITEGWRKDVKDYSVMEGGGIHMIDLMLYLTQQNPDSVYSVSNKLATKNTAFKYHDFQTSIFTFKSGLIGKITANFGCMHPHQHVIKIYGTRGTFIYDDQGARIYWERDESVEPQRLLMPPKPKQKGLLLNEFIKVISSGDFKNTAQREFDLMSVVLAADKALVKNTEINIGYLAC